MLRDVNEERCKAILTSEEGWTDPNPDSAEHTKEMFTFCKTFYDGAMDEAAIESRGYEPLEPILSSIDSLDSLENLTSLLADLHTTHGINILFSYGSTIDKKNSDMTIGKRVRSLPLRCKLRPVPHPKSPLRSSQLGSTRLVLGFPTATTILTRTRWRSAPHTLITWGGSSP